MSEISILIVEPDPTFKRFYENVFSASQDWTVVFCTNFRSALELLSERSYDYVISEGFIEDSSITGLDFLKKVSTDYPETIRIYVSGSIVPSSEDYYYFHTYINKVELDCNSLLEVMNYMTDSLEIMPS